MATRTGTTAARTPADTRPGRAPGAVEVLAAATPAHRDKVVDLLRAVSIGVVVLWHWSLSVTHWGGGRLRMPNPVGDVPGLWTATWVLQVMPLFFLVGGYANLAGWRSVTRDGGAGAAGRFWARRFSRLLRPVAVYVACWAVVDVLVLLAGGPSVLRWGMVVFVPLWFLGVYAAVVALVPWTARLHDAHPLASLAMLGGGAALADVARFGFGLQGAGLLGSACVWVFCHQLGYLWSDLVGSPRPDDGAGSRVMARAGARVRGGGALVVAGLTGLAALTSVGPYPRSMVAVRGEEVGNMFPTTVCVAVLAVLQLGLVLALRDGLARWLERPRVWRSVIAVNAVAMTVFCWHMTALVGFLLAYDRLGFTLAEQPTTAWWVTRPLWVAGPAVLLAGLVALFARFEIPRGLGRRTAAGSRARAR